MVCIAKTNSFVKDMKIQIYFLLFIIINRLQNLYFISIKDSKIVLQYINGLVFFKTIASFICITQNKTGKFNFSPKVILKSEITYKDLWEILDYGVFPVLSNEKFLNEFEFLHCTFNSWSITSPYHLAYSKLGLYVHEPTMIWVV